MQRVGNPGARDSHNTIPGAIYTHKERTQSGVVLSHNVYNSIQGMIQTVKKLKIEWSHIECKAMDGLRIHLLRFEELYFTISTQHCYQLNIPPVSVS